MNTTLTPAEVLARAPYRGKLLIDGTWQDAADGSTLERRSPAHDQVVAVYALAGVADAERAIAAARRAFDDGPWPRLKGAERARILRAVAEGILARKHELATLETLENGKPLAQSLGEIEAAADLWHYAATLARQLHGDSYNTLGENTLGVVLRDPVGVVSIITPWNFPFLIVSQELPFALAAGCTTVVKPAEVTSGTTVMLGEILVAAMDRAGMYVEPTVVTGVTCDIAIAREEVFGPVLSVLSFKDLNQAVALANSTLYGLSAAAWSRDFSTCLEAARPIRAGTVRVNTFLEGRAELQFGGYRESGIGRELGGFAAEDYTETKTLHMHLGGRTDWYVPK
jgi:acyl-CoA reductase-like NAD-dependent aldehyde dehydrogenase